LRAAWRLRAAAARERFAAAEEVVTVALGAAGRAGAV
jgi:hypothetical protein